MDHARYFQSYPDTAVNQASLAICPAPTPVAQPDARAQYPMAPPQHTVGHPLPHADQPTAAPLALVSRPKAQPLPPPTFVPAGGVAPSPANQGLFMSSEPTNVAPTPRAQTRNFANRRPISEDVSSSSTFFATCNLIYCRIQCRVRQRSTITDHSRSPPW